MKLILASLLALSLFASAATPRPAPGFTFIGAGGTKSLKSLRGQPVVLFLADSPSTRAFKKQLKRTRPIYQEFASRGVVFAAAFSKEGGQVPSDIPVVVVNNGPAVAAAYDMRGNYLLAIIGKDGNLDLITDKVVAATRLREVIQNSFEVQKEIRRPMPAAPDR